MLIKDLFERKKVVYSFELFPPKPTSPIETLQKALDELKELSPDYISITYGTGAGIGDNTLNLCRLIKREYKIEPLSHLTCIHSNKQGILKYLKELEASGIENILALRGDVKPDFPLSKDFRYASELIEFIRQHGNFGISAACYPEGHFEAPDIVADIKNLKKKVDAGAQHLNTQLFFDNEDFYRFMEMAQIAGIGVPIQAGVMPLVKRRQIERIIGLTGVKIPAKISRMLAKLGDSDQALFDAGIAYATEQIIDLLSYGVRGIHLYIMNNAAVAKRITQNISSIIRGQ
jgi:methylenetetrahydrofolate reductase (NADPH)